MPAGATIGRDRDQELDREEGRWGGGRSRVEGVIPPAGETRASRAVARARIARGRLENCHLCVCRCGADRRFGPAGQCRAGPEARWFSAQMEVTDELVWLPTYAIALAGCNLRCAFCITGESSWNAGAGEACEAASLGGRVAAALARGARTVMILGGEPTVHLPALLDLVGALPEEAPVVLKTNACFSEVARPLLGGLFDAWLPDCKFGNDDCARRLARVDGYWATVTANLEWMAADRERPASAMPRLVIRHLLMPGHVDCCWAPVARWLRERLPGVPVSLRSGYWPAWQAWRHAELRRLVARPELDRARAIGRECGLTLIP